MSGILPVIGSKGHGYRNCLSMAMNTLVQQLWKKKLYLWNSDDVLLGGLTCSWEWASPKWKGCSRVCG